MERVIPTIAIFLAVILVIQFFLRRKNKIYDTVDDYIEAEFQSNYTRKQPIEKELYIQPDFSKLSIKNYEEIEDGRYNALKRILKNVKINSTEPMIKFETPKTNLELKLKYGVANLELITRAEDNYNKYIISLVLLAEELIKQEEFEDAKTVLINSIEFYSDLSKSYLLLFDIYKTLNEEENIEEFLLKLEDDEYKHLSKELKYKLIYNIKNTYI